ncbi:MAG: DNA mismatch repair endonuclease MutL [Dehalococcoidia bacterium]
MPIRVLSPAVAAGIAAGEVIERPASVVKELVENSLDAGATTVAVDLKQGGLQSIRVSDNGCGIPEEELELAFQRHSTSKLSALDDLASLATFGFRGEALASVAAVGHVTISTRTPTSDAGEFLELEGGTVLQKRKRPAALGTTIEVEALFATIPARLKFIRSASAETARVRQTVDHMALAYPHVQFVLKTENRTLLQTSGNGYLRDVVAAVHGPDLAASMLEVTPSTQAPYAASGLVGLPEHSRPNRTGISLFVNGRWVQSRTLSVAIEEAYRGLLMEGRYPIAVVFLEITPGEVDVNVHPNKREVRFVRDGDAFASVQRAVREALLAASPVAEAGGLFTSASPTGMPAPALSPVWRGFSISFSGGLGPLPEPVQHGQPVVSDVGPVPLQSTPYSGADGEAATEDDAQALPQGHQDPGSPMPLLRVLGQIANAYIVAEGPDGMYLIDQHAAHESVLYYRLLQQWETSSPEVQPLLEPMTLDLAPEQMEVMESALPSLERYGLHLEPFGSDVWLLRAVPAMARRINAQRLVAEVLETHRHGVSPAESHLAVAASLACHSAVRAGQGLDQQEMEALANALVMEGNPQHCPHGRPTTVRVTTGMLERQFGRV